MDTIENNGCQLAFRLLGSGPPILFIQGVGVHGDGWAPQVDALSDRFTCLTFDNRGLGRSQPQATAKLSIDDMVADCLAIGDAVAWDRFHVVGHSMGGHIASALALATPDRVKSLALMCTSLRGKDMPPLTPSMLWTSLRSRVGPRRSRRSAFLEFVLPSSRLLNDDLVDWAGRLEDIFGHDLADTPPIVLDQVRAYRRHDPTPQLERLHGIPTLVVAAEEDPLAPPRLGRALAAAIPSARYVEVPDASHGVTVTHADEINALVAAHIDGVP